jgi:fatty acid desaturase
MVIAHNPNVDLFPGTRKTLSARVFRKWLLPALAEWIAILGLFAVGFALHRVLVWAVVTVLVGSRQHALGVLGHDSAHFAASKDRRVNDLSAELLCFWPLITGLADFRQFHLNHHRYFNTDKDPELLFKDNWSRAQWALPMSRAQIISYFLLDLVGFGVFEVMKAYWLLGKTCKRSWIGPALWWTGVGSLLHFSGLDFAIVIWFVALITSFWGFFRLRTWTEHVGSSSTHRMRANWWQRILITPHCSWSHYEHHEHPAVPFWRRHELRDQEAITVSMGELFASFSAGRKSVVDLGRTAG